MKKTTGRPGLCVVIACAGALAACDDGGSGSFHGTYEVPVPSALEAAATYDVPEVEWIVDGDDVELRYDLPRALVGKAFSLRFEGTISGSTAKLTGSPGTADCTLTATEVVCNESMTGLLPITPDYAIVEELAATEYPGPAADRLDVAKRFAGDPIGIVRIDLTTPGGASDKP
jgi:hypothetical protein